MNENKAVLTAHTRIKSICYTAHMSLITFAHINLSFCVCLSSLKRWKKGEEERIIKTFVDVDFRVLIFFFADLLKTVQNDQE